MFARANEVTPRVPTDVLHRTSAPGDTRPFLLPVGDAHNMQVAMPRVDGVDEPVLVPGNPVKMTAVAEGPETRVPWLGEHTDDVLGAVLGLEDVDLAGLRERGTIA